MNNILVLLVGVLIGVAIACLPFWLCLIVEVFEKIYHSNTDKGIYHVCVREEDNGY